MGKIICSIIGGTLAGAGIVYFAKRENRERAKARGREICGWASAKMTEATQAQLARELAVLTGWAEEACRASISALIQGKRPPHQATTPEGVASK